MRKGLLEIEPRIPVRGSIKNLEAYMAGKPIAELEREIPGLKGRRIIKLASNENPLGPSPKAVAAMRKALNTLHRYPEPTSPVLRAALAEKHGVTADQILAGSGADEILRLIVEGIVEPGDSCVLSQWAFSRFRQHIRLMGGRVIEVPMRSFRHDLAGMARAAREQNAKAVFIANPNNPTSTFNTHQEVMEMFDILGPQGPLVVLDEAYAEFASDAYPEYPHSVPAYFKRYPRLIVLRTLSKVMGLAGIRVGYGVSSEEFISSLNRARLIFNVNSLAQTGALGALKDAAHIRKTLKVIKEGRLFLEQSLAALGFAVERSGASNFVFAKCPSGTGRELYQKLLREGVIIRPVGEKGLESYVRISIGTPRENKILVSALKKFFE